jgi:hypothetical protein
LNIDSKPEPSEPEQLESELHQFRAPALAKWCGSLRLRLPRQCNLSYLSITLYV